MNRESFILYTIHKPAWKSLSDEDAGLLIKAILDYQTGEDVSLPPIPNAFFTMIKAYLDRDAEKWAQTVEKRRQAGAKGGVASGRSRRKQPQANEANASDALPSLLDEANEASASFAKQTKQTQANEANQATPSCIDVSCCEYENERKNIYINNSSYPAPFSPEDVEEAKQDVRRDRQRGDYEFSLLRSEYDRARQEGPMAGRAEFMALYHSQSWPGIDEILSGLNRLIEGDYQFIEKTYTPGLAKFITQQLWKMAPRKLQPKPGQDPEPTDEEKAVQERIERLRAKMKADEEERKAKAKAMAAAIARRR